MLLLLLLLGAPAGAQEEEVDLPRERVDLGVYGEPIRLEPAGGILEVDGRRYDGALEVLPRPGGELQVVNEVGTEAYVAGIAEMPSSWPIEALKAQAVAARTYAWYQTRLESFDGYDICDSTACQVYRGRETVEGPRGERWRQAVDATAGEVLMYDGAPILARYFSTSGGATRNNEDVFPSEGPRPYLKGRPDPEDAVSPLHTWTARFTREQLDEILSRGRQLSAAVPVAEMRRVDPPGEEPPVVRVTGRDGTTAEVTAVAFRRFVSDVAPELFPDAFPGPRGDGRPLPTTVPSSRFDVEITDDAVILHGRGWGHGVGMGQYGAMGKAEQGMNYREILAAYYTGVEMARPEALPDRFRVGLGRGDEGVEVDSDAPFRVLVGGREIVGRGLGTWRIEPGADATLRLHAPPGYGAPLVVSPTTPSRQRPTAVEVITLETVVNKPAELALEVTDGDGATVLRRSEGVVDPGRHRVRWDLDDGEGTQLEGGSYRVRLVATDEADAAAGEPATVDVRDITVPEEPPPTLLAAAEDDGGVPPGPLAVGAVVGVLAGVLVGRRLVRR